MPAIPRTPPPEAGLGHQFIADLHDCRASLQDPAMIRRAALKAAELGKATVLKEVTHEFSPHGISCVLVIAESHLALHTWPEHHYVAVDLFTCDLTVKGEDILSYLQQEFQSQQASFQRIERGTPSGQASISPV